MLRIGLTGGIGAGKSTVSAAFNECGGIIVDGDVIAREVVEPGTEGLAALVDALAVTDPNSGYDCAVLGVRANLVFSPGELPDNQPRRRHGP